MPTWDSHTQSKRRKGKHYGPNEQSHRITCAWCHTEVLRARPDAEYCSVAHRNAAKRARDREKAHIEWEQKVTTEAAARAAAEKKKRPKAKQKKQSKRRS
jgi:hypothetical protein